MFAKMTPVLFQGKTYHVAYNAWAMFQIQDLSEKRDVMDVLTENGSEDFPLFCKAAEIMSEAAESIRRYEGRDSEGTLKGEQVSCMATPMDILNLRQAMLAAVIYGYGREIEEENEEIDLGLAELQKKTN